LFVFIYIKDDKAKEKSNETSANTTTKSSFIKIVDDKNKTQTQQKDLKDMTDKEIAAHYKSLFLKSKKLILHYEEELNLLKNNVSNLKQKLKEYESGIKTIINLIYKLEEGMTCEVLFRFEYNDSSFFFFKNENRNVLIIIFNLI